VHDVARPFIHEDLVARVVRAAKKSGAAIPGIAICDAVKEVGETGLVVHSLARKWLRAIQTPMAFDAALLRRAYRHAKEKGISVIDDAALVEKIGHEVVVVEGDRDNIKITMREDLERAKQILHNPKFQIPNKSQ